MPNPQAATEPNVIKQEITRPTEQKAVPSLPTQQSEDVPQAAKEPLTRLLDLMLGWTEYIAKTKRSMATECGLVTSTRHTAWWPSLPNNARTQRIRVNIC